MNIDNLIQLQERLGVQFHDERLLRQALVHRSYLNESPGFELPSNERLEFLGDSVLGFIVAEHLYRHFPADEEGRLTEMRVSLIRTATLAQAARALGLGQYLLMGRGEEASGGRSRPSILEAAFEALLGAIFLDKGIDVARAFVIGRLSANLARLEQGARQRDAKSTLQEYTQRHRQLTPSYHTVSAVGPDHAKVFTVEVRLGNEVLAEGRGRSKQEAEQDAAQHALENLPATPRD